MALALDHVVIHVSDWERSNAFYRDVLGAELVERDGGHGPPLPLRRSAAERARSRPGPAPVAARPAAPGGADLCFVWDGPIDAAASHLEAHGVELEEGPVTRYGGRGRGLERLLPRSRRQPARAHLVRMRALARAVLAAVAAAVVAGADWVIRFRPPRWIVLAVFDHPAHLATAGLIALNLPSRSPRWHAGFMAGSLLPDVDHVPLALAEQHPTSDDRAPRHPLPAAVAPLFALAAGHPQRAPRRSRLGHARPLRPRRVPPHRALRCSGPFAMTTCDSLRGLRAAVAALTGLALARDRALRRASRLLPSAYSRSRPSSSAPAHISGASGRGP